MPRKLQSIDAMPASKILGLEIPDAEAEKLVTVGAAIEYLEKKMAEKGAAK